MHTFIEEEEKEEQNSLKLQRPVPPQPVATDTPVTNRVPLSPKLAIGSVVVLIETVEVVNESVDEQRERVADMSMFAPTLSPWPTLTDVEVQLTQKRPSLSSTL
jgi:hypothetical protein